MTAKREIESAIAAEASPSFPTSGVGAVVMGGDHQGLGIVRSLGAAGIPVCIIDDEYSVARFSRYATHSVQVKDLRDEQTTIEAVLATGRSLKLNGWVLYPTRDETVAAFSRHRDRLSHIFRVPTANWDTIQWAWDKRNTYKLARDLGIPIPKTWFLESVEDVERVDAEFPLIIKPAIKEHFFYATKSKAWRADNRDDLVRRFREATSLVPATELILQELILGGSKQQYGYCAIFKEGRALGSMTTHYLRSHPLELGRSSTFVESIELPIVEERAQQFLRAINYYGLVEVEFRLDPRDGEYKLLDVNARTWGYHSLGEVAGVDFSRMLFDDQMGRSVATARARPGLTWIRLATDIPTGLLAILRRQLSPWKFVRSLVSFDAEPVFSLKDPVPGLAEMALIPYLFYKRGF